MIFLEKNFCLSICCYYCIPWIPSYRLICIKPYLFIFGGHLGHQRSVERQTLYLLLLLYSLGFQISFDMHKALAKTFSFLEVIQVIRGRKRSLEGQILDLLLLLYSLGSQLSFDMHKAIVEIFSICGGHQRSLKFNFILFQEFRSLIRRAPNKLEDLNQK